MQIKLKLMMFCCAVVVASVPILSGGEKAPPESTLSHSQLIYQGTLPAEHRHLTGWGDFKFVLVDAEGRTLWSNDGTSTNGGEPIEAMELRVEEGEFDVSLGAPSMQALPADVFQGSSAPVLRVWVDIGDGFKPLSDQTVGRQTGLEPFSDLQPNALAMADCIYCDPSGRVGINTLAPAGKLDIRVGGGDGASVLRLSTEQPWEFRQSGSGSGANLELRSVVDGRKFIIRGQDDHKLAVFETDNGNSSRKVALVPDGGRVGIGTTNPQSKLEVTGSGATFPRGSASPDGYFTHFPWTGDGRNYIRGDTVIADRGGMVGIGTNNPQSKLEVIGGGATFPRGGAAEAGGYTHFPWDGDGRNYIRGETIIADSGGKVGIGTTDPKAKLHVAGGIHVQGSLRDLTWAPGESLQLGEFDGTNFTQRFVIESNTGRVGIGTSRPAVQLHVAGTTQTGVLDIVGGSDLAEPFDVADGDTVQPGMVLSIDPDQTGQLRISSVAYDKSVAGIVSGANGINAGLTMRQAGSVADGSRPVALTGRVWCWCDADRGGPITPGDLLTTSESPGHAMRVTDNRRAQGATLGKAMSRLESGRGLVLVLVSLQ